MKIRQFCCDDETGEVVTYDVDEETGEPVVENRSPALYIENKTNYQESKTKYMKFPRGAMCNTKKYESLKAKIIAGYNPISHRMFLIPSMMLFPRLLCVMLTIFEVYLHVKCHQKNKKLKNTNMYYQSPFHIITSIFCGACRENDSAFKIGQLQDERRDRYDYFRSLAI